MPKSGNRAGIIEPAEAIAITEGHGGAACGHAALPLRDVIGESLIGNIPLGGALGGIDGAAHGGVGLHLGVGAGGELGAESGRVGGVANGGALVGEQAEGQAGFLRSGVSGSDLLERLAEARVITCRREFIGSFEQCGRGGGGGTG